MARSLICAFLVVNSYFTPDVRDQLSGSVSCSLAYGTNVRAIKKELQGHSINTICDKKVSFN